MSCLTPPSGGTGRRTFNTSSFTGKASNALFFARYEAARSEVVEIDHILSGLLRADPLLFQRLFPDQAEPLQRLIASLRFEPKPFDVYSRENLPPFSSDTERILASATSATEEFGQTEVGTEHILLALLRDHCDERIHLNKLGLTEDMVQQEILTRQSERQ